MANTPVPVNMLGGVNLHDDPSALAENEACWLENMYPVTPGVLQTREGMQCISQERISNGLPRYWGGQRVESWATCYDVHFTQAFSDCVYVAHVAGGLGAASGALSWDNNSENWLIIQRKDGVVDIPFPIGPVRDRVQFLEYEGAVLCITGFKVFKGSETLPAKWEEVIFTGPGLGATATGPWTPQVGCVWANRVLYGSGSTLVISDEGDPAKIGPARIVGEGDERITALYSVALAEVTDGYKEAVMLHTRESAWMITDPGSQVDDAPIVRPTIARMQANAGCVSHASVARNKHGVMWCGPDDVWAMRNGGLPERVGTKLRPRIVAMGQPQQWRIHACWDRDAYVLALQGDYPQRIEAVTSNGVVSEPLAHHWRLDCRQGFPGDAKSAAWYGPQIYRSLGAWEDTASSGERGAGTTNLRTQKLSDSSSRGTSVLPVQNIAPVANITSFRALVGLNMVSFDSPNAFDSAWPVNMTSYPNRQMGTVYAAPDAADSQGYLQNRIWEGEYCWIANGPGETDPASTDSFGGAFEPCQDLTSSFFSWLVGEVDITWYAWAYNQTATSGRHAFIAHLSQGRLLDSAILPKWRTRQVSVDAVVDVKLDRVEIGFESRQPVLAKYRMWPHHDNWGAGAQKLLSPPSYVNTLSSGELDTSEWGPEIDRWTRNYLPWPPERRRGPGSFSQWEVSQSNTLYEQGAFGEIRGMWFVPPDSTLVTVLYCEDFFGNKIIEAFYTYYSASFTNRPIAALEAAQVERNAALARMHEFFVDGVFTVADWSIPGAIGDLQSGVPGGVQRGNNNVVVAVNPTSGVYAAMLYTGWLIRELPAGNTVPLDVVPDEVFASSRIPSERLGFNADSQRAFAASWDQDGYGTYDCRAPNPPNFNYQAAFKLRAQNAFITPFGRRNP